MGKPTQIDHEKRKLQRQLRGTLTLSDPDAEKLAYLLADGLKREEIEKHLNLQPTTVDAVLMNEVFKRRLAYLQTKNADDRKALYRAWVFAPVHIDWVQEHLLSSFRVYAPEKFLVDQGEGVSFISGRDNPRMTWNHSDPKCIVVLRAPKGVMDALRTKGWHNGFWRDGTEGYDVGLSALLKQSDPVVMFQKLKDLLGVYVQESANIKDGLPVVWHPEIPVDWVRMSSKVPVLEIRNATAPEQCLEALSQWKVSYGQQQGV